MEMVMNVDQKHLNQLLRTVHYPVSKGDLIELFRQNGLNAGLINELEAILPDKDFNSANEVLDLIPTWEES
jgi:uncharacterized protein DUF2795